MWCPRCKQEFPRRVRLCPLCGMALLDVPPEDGPGPAAEDAEFLLHFDDPLALEQALEILRRAGVPHLYFDRRWASSSRIASIRKAEGLDLYVARRYTHRARRLLRQFDPDAQTPFDDEELEAAMEDYYAGYGSEAEEEEPAEPVSPEGYRTLFVLLGLLALFVLTVLIVWAV